VIQAGAAANPASVFGTVSVPSTTPARVEHLQGVAVTVGVTADDDIELFGQHGHCGPGSLPDATVVVGVGPGGDHRRHIREESRARGADRVLIRSADGQTDAGTRDDRSRARHTAAAR
jgi:hypothetical protein